ncbi:hypothetical protein CAPTEDRAFT_222884 [Capitella teleta]|uniref:SUEL-type lectin domain-containing protein n=1 Tax=Capitella teleta TaxID=283909 RepID=R7UA22_CAPTE|nr:hypothetical protein CAPTEDRAFT_222884 [Capitella teleta]|eukprot:ELU02936.1 hypothetical protein CAPTEDRAFT_222884 [Capitella teleta]
MDGITFALMTAVCAFAFCQAGPQEPEEFCERDIFSPSCEENEVLLISHALYGRMRVGRCISRTYGGLGCSLDARRLLDAKCSGRRSCEVIVANMVPERMQPCPADLRGYLEVSYECVKVAYASPKYCQPSSVIELRQPVGYMSSLVTTETNCGSFDSPWWVAAKTGQTLRLTLLDFEEYLPSVGQPTCQVYVVIKEEGLQQAETVCASSAREKIVYISQSNTIEVRIVGGQSEEANRKTNHFLLKYEAIGCPDPTPPIHGWVKRVHNDVTIGCNASGANTKWRLKCQDNQWVGSYKNCSADGAVLTGQSSMGGFDSLSNAHGYSILIIVCIACLVGLGILLFGLIYLRRKRSEQRPRASPGSTVQRDLHSNYKTSDYQAHSLQQQSMSKSQDNLGSYVSSTENDYYRTWQLQRHSQQPPPAHAHGLSPTPSPFTPGLVPVQYYDERTGTGPGLATYNSDNRSRYSEHIYESPNFERKDFGITADGVPVDYFELDPDSPINHNPGIIK